MIWKSIGRVLLCRTIRTRRRPIPHTLRWDIHMKEKEGLIKRKFSVAVQHPKGGNIVWTCGNYHVVGGE